MGTKKKNGGKSAARRFFSCIRSDLPDEEDKKSPVLLLGVNKISDSPSFVRRRSVNHHHQTGSIRFFRPPKSKYTRGLRGDERLEKIRQDLLVHKTKPDRYIPSSSHEVCVEPEKRCLKLNCAGNCICEKKHNSSNRGSFTFHVPEQRQSSLCPSEPYEKVDKKDLSETDIEFKYTEHVPDCQPGSSKQNSYNVTPKSVDRRHFLLSNLNERFRKTLSLDSRKIETNRVPLSLPKETRPKSLVNTSNIVQHFKADDPFMNQNFSKASQPKKKRKSFFSLDTFFDSKKSDTSSTDDYCSSKYKRFELESDDSPLFHRNDNNAREKVQRAPDLLNLPVIIDSVRKKHSDTRRQLEKLENHYYNTNKTVIDAVPKDATNQHGHTNRVFVDDDEVEYIEPIGSNTKSNFTSQSTLILEKNIPDKPDSILTIFTDETDIRLPSSTVSPKSDAKRENDLDSIGAYEIEVKESDLLNAAKNLTVKVMDKSVDSIGSCSLDVDASTDFSDTTSGSLNLLTPSSTGSRVREFTSRLQERAALLPNLTQTPAPTPTLTPRPYTPEDLTPTPKKAQFKKEPPKSDNLLKPPGKLEAETASHRSRHKKREVPIGLNKKPSYLHLACSVNGYTNLTTYDSKLRQDINRSREASPIRPITHTYQYKSETGSLLVPVPVSANRLLLPTLGPHEKHQNLTARAPTKALTEPALSTPHHTTMADENKQLRNDFLGPGMTDRTFISPESKSFATTMLHSRDEVDDVREGFKSSYSENNFRKTTVTNGKETTQRLTSESYTITSNGVSKRIDITKENGEQLTSPMKSFIQQRVERLYGPGALAQGFLMQKRQKKSFCEEDKVLTEKSLNCQSNFSTPRKSTDSVEYTSPIEETESNVALPVLRHLRPEFRAQLPILSPKKGLRLEVSPQKEKNIPIKTEVEPVNGTSAVKNSSELSVVTNGVSVIALEEVNGSVTTNGEVVKDGHYFLSLEKKETERLLALAASAEKELENLQSVDTAENAERMEEVRGLLRAASGKARLLATQKMQQFQGLCYNNINDVVTGGAFPTTCADLQGFWDMVCLQVKHVDQLYDHIDRLKANGWKEPVDAIFTALYEKCLHMKHLDQFYEHIDMLKSNGWKELEPTPKKSQQAPSVNSSSVNRRTRTATPAQNEKARLAAEKREADRRAMMEHRRRLAREKQLATRAATPGTSRADQMGIEGSQEVEIFVGHRTKQDAHLGDCSTPHEGTDTPPTPTSS